MIESVTVTVTKEGMKLGGGLKKGGEGLKPEGGPPEGGPEGWLGKGLEGL